MIRVGLALTFTDQTWLGGLNYFRNLLRAVTSLPGRKIEPILFSGHQSDRRLYKDFPIIEQHQTPLLDLYSGKWWCRKLCQKVLRRDILFEYFLRRHAIDVLSHSAPLGRWATLPTLGWVADFQHRHLPHFFSQKEYAARERNLRRVCRESHIVLVSSAAARRDLADFWPEAVHRSRVLHFVVDPTSPDSVPDRKTLETRYKFAGHYFYLPNQFWAHKNHATVIEALALLKKENRPVQVLATGSSRDTRNPDFFDCLMRQAHQANVLDCFRVLGVVPYADLIGLMQSADALINPSLFEGWSTTVEEGKSLGKRMILSDLPVHREQAPPAAIFFIPRDAAGLAAAINQVREERRSDLELYRQAQAKANLPERIRHFATDYERVIDLTLQSAPNRRRVCAQDGDVPFATPETDG